MFEINEKSKPVYWCVAFINGGSYVIVKLSEDALQHDIMPDGAYDESLFDSLLSHQLPSGLYHLKLNPWSHGPDMQGEYDCGVDIVKAICLYTHNNQHETG